jgi:F-type H+-transporting ATPase subunit delta
MAESVTIARPYAKAAFKHADEQGTQEQWAGMLAFAAAVVLDENMTAVLDNPMLTAEKQSEAFIQVCGDKLDDSGKNFIRQMAQNKRLSVLPEVSVLFDLLLAEQQKTEEVQVTSAYALSDADVAKLRDALAKKIGKAVSVQTDVDSELIGGVVIRAGDMVIDDSVRGKLDRLSHQLN